MVRGASLEHPRSIVGASLEHTRSMQGACREHIADIELELVSLGYG